MNKLLRVSVPVLFSVLAFGAATPVALAAATLDSFIVGSQSPASITSGSSATYSISFSSHGSGSETASLSITTSLPTGAIASFIPSAPQFKTQTSTLTISTTGVSAGSYPFTVQADAGTHGGALTASGTLVVALDNQAALSVTGLPASATYQQASIVAGIAGGSGAGDVTYSAGASTACSIDSSSGAVTIIHGSGTCSITATKAADSTYNATTSAPVSITVSKATVTASVTADTKVYDGTDTATISSCVPATVIGTDVVTCSAGGATFSDKNVGTGKTVTATGITLGGANSADYQLSSTSATATADITTNNITITADAKAKNYGAGDPALSYQITSGSLGAGDSFTGSLTRDAGEDVGSYAITQGTVALNSNYSLSYVGANLVIGQATVTVTADAQSKTYGDADPTLTYQSSGLQGTDTLSGALERVAGEDVGTYAITQGTLTAGSNYNISYTGANLTITKAAANVTVTPYSVTYDGSAHTATGTATGVNGEDLSAQLDLSSTSHTNVGSWSDGWTFSGGTNYNDQTGTANDEITKANANVTVTPYTVTYDGSSHTATGTATGVLGEDLSAQLDLSGTTHTATSTYAGDPWTFTDVTGNYNDQSGSVTDVISDLVVHSLTYSAGSNGMLTGTTTQSVVDGADGTAVTAVADSGFHFVNWSDSSTANPRTDTGVTGDVSVTANFAADTVATVTTPVHRGRGNRSTRTSVGQVLGAQTSTGQVLGASTFIFANNLRFRMTSPDVAEIQRALVAAGYSIPDAVTNYFGPQTFAAVKAFQKAHGLPMTGWVGPMTRALLNATSTVSSQ